MPQQKQQKRQLGSEKVQQQEQEQQQNQQQQQQQSGEVQQQQEGQQQASSTGEQQAVAGLAAAGLTVEQAADKTQEHAMAAMMGGGPPQWGGRFDNRLMPVSKPTPLCTAGRRRPLCSMSWLCTCSAVVSTRQLPVLDPRPCSTAMSALAMLQLVKLHHQSSLYRPMFCNKLDGHGASSCRHSVPRHPG